MQLKPYLIILPFLYLFSCTETPVPTEYIIAEKSFVPEGITYSKQTDKFYLTSVGLAKILELDRKTGEQIDFISQNEYDYTPGAGILVDEDEQILYALGGYYQLSDPQTSLFGFDIKTKKLIKKYDAPEGSNHFLNDLIQDKEGNLYITDSKDSSVYILDKGSESIKLFFKSPEIEFPNGIAISDDNSKLYIASMVQGVRILDLETMNLLNDRDTMGISQGIDGLEFHNDHLYAVQNSVGANSFNFRKLILNENQDGIIDVEVIDSHNPELDVPLTFCIAGRKAIVIGNSNLQHLDQKTFKFNDSETVLPTRLLTYDLGQSQ